MRYLNDQALSAADISTDQPSSAIDASYLIMASVQGVVSGTVAGTLKLQGSNDRVSPTHWSDIASASVAISNSGTYVIGKTELCHQWVRVFYASTSGTGTLTANLKTTGF